MSRFDAVVIGAGPAGGVTALLLARAGRRVALVEKRAFPRGKVCGEFLSATNALLLDRLGLGDDWRAMGGPDIRRVALFSGETTVAAPMPRDGGGGWGRAIGRTTLDTLLAERAAAAGATLFQPARAVGLERAGNSFRVRVEGRGGADDLRAGLVVAAHGSWERGTLPTDAPKSALKSGRPGDLFGFKARFRGARLSPDLMPLLLFPGGYGGMVTTDGGEVSLSLCLRRDVLERARAGGGSAAEAVRHHLDTHCRGVREALAGAETAGAWLASGPIRPGIRPAYAGGVFRAGNLAGEAHPIVAEGISMALQAGFLLGERLAAIDPEDAGARDRAGRLYASDWRRQFAFRIRAAAALARLSLSPAGGLVAPTVRLLPALLTAGAALSGKTRALPLDARPA